MSLTVATTSKAIKDLAVDSIVIFVEQMDSKLSGELKALDGATGGAVTALVESEEFTGKIKQTGILMRPSGYKADRVILTGVGPSDKITPDSYRKAAGVAASTSGMNRSATAAFVLESATDENCFQAAVEGQILRAYKFNRYKTKDAKADRDLEELQVVVLDKKRDKKIASAIERGQAMAEGQCLVRDLANTPANDLTPIVLADQAKELGRRYKFSTRVLDEKKIASEKMGALLAVAQGSDNPPRFVIMNYKGGKDGQKPVVLVGKGVTFDTGGISLKPPANMHEMKADMTGSAVVLAAMVTIARLKLPINVVGLIPTVENMPSSKAYRPGDVITSRKGLTIEVISTDAEGRLILADALDYANKFEPQAVIDVATLTGGALYVLGYSGAPIMGNNDTLSERFYDAAEVSGERVWRMPLWDDFHDLMKSPVADLKNSGGKPAATMSAGAFLENFIGDWPWMHVDIAYVDQEPSGREYIPKGVTGIGMRLIVQVLSDWKKL